MAMAPIVVHPPLGMGGRRARACGRVIDLAYSDVDVIEFLRRAGLPDAEELLDDPWWVKWRGGRAYHHEAA
ncbi:hypothetical protein [Streptomyces sp. NPDC059262]|uniref:hypothetical protein n=1 Tax=Streptomyces sp. NPDC059262 TaxID=3346797 RepID=UPI00369EA33A